jgi:hypothetical protein
VQQCTLLPDEIKTAYLELKSTILGGRVLCARHPRRHRAALGASRLSPQESARPRLASRTSPAVIDRSASVCITRCLLTAGAQMYVMRWT